jgi:signal transduction histidine kinase
VATLPARSAVFYGQVIVDASGFSYTDERALTELHAVANAPIFGIHDYQLGRGIVGGRLSSVRELSRHTAVAAGRILRGESPRDIRPPPLRAGPPIYDWRELRRWGIAEASLPQGSEVRFREPALWQRYFGQIVLMILALLAQGVIISFLLVNRTRRRRAEQTAREFGGRLLHAQEAERARLARELHDDITQRLARLAIDAGRIESGRAGAGKSETMRDVRDGLVRLSEDVHSLAYRLHPSLVEDLGLADALRAECERLSRLESISIDVKLDPVPGKIPRDAGLCLFRVTQEALRNVVRHARTKAAEVSLRLVDGGLQLAVTDGGVGLTSPAASGAKPRTGQHAGTRPVDRWRTGHRKRSATATVVAGCHGKEHRHEPMASPASLAG